VVSGKEGGVPSGGDHGVGKHGREGGGAWQVSGASGGQREGI
jgi:hypothetical protein